MYAIRGLHLHIGRGVCWGRGGGFLQLDSHVIYLQRPAPEIYPCLWTRIPSSDRARHKLPRKTWRPKRPCISSQWVIARADLVLLMQRLPQQLFILELLQTCWKLRRRQPYTVLTYGVSYFQNTEPDCYCLNSASFQTRGDKRFNFVVGHRRFGIKTKFFKKLILICPRPIFNHFQFF